MDGIMSSKIFATRQGTIFVGVIAAVVAAIALIVYLNSYRNSVNNNAASTVLVAKGLIQKGTPGEVVGSSELYKTSSIAKSNVQTGALLDASALAGTVAVRDVYPGQQLTATDFAPATDTLISHLNPSQRAVTIALDSAPQVGGQIGGGSHVDVWVSYSTSGGTPTMKLLFQDIYVLGASGDNVTLRTTPRQAGQIIFASANADNVWFDLRPTVAKNVSPVVINGTRG